MIAKQSSHTAFSKQRKIQHKPQRKPLKMKKIWVVGGGQRKKESSATLVFFLTRVLTDLSEAARFYSTW